MNNDRDDERLRRIFAELRQAGHAATPPFERVWASAVAGKVRGNPRAWLAAAVSCIAVAVGVVVMVLRHGAPSGFEAAAQLAAWRSPTASLLRVPGTDILRVVPGVGASLVRPETLQPVIGGGSR